MGQQESLESIKSCFYCERGTNTDDDDVVEDLACTMSDMEICDFGEITFIGTAVLERTDRGMISDQFTDYKDLRIDDIEINDNNYYGSKTDEANEINSRYRDDYNNGTNEKEKKQTFKTAETQTELTLKTAETQTELFLKTSQSQTELNVEIYIDSKKTTIETDSNGRTSDDRERAIESSKARITDNGIEYDNDDEQEIKEVDGRRTDDLTISTITLKGIRIDDREKSEVIRTRSDKKLRFDNKEISTDSGRTDDLHPVTELTSQEINLLEQTWQSMQQGVTENGMHILVQFFTRYPHYHQLSPFKDVPLNDLRENVEFQMYVKRSIILDLGLMVDNVNDLVTMRELLVKQGMTGDFKGVNEEAFRELKFIIMELFSTQMSLEAVKAWEKLLNVGLTSLAEGVRKAKKK